MSVIIGEIVKSERKLQSLTQSELGELAGTGLNFVSQLERGKQTVRLDKTLSILKVLGIELVLSRGSRGVVANSITSFASDKAKAEGKLLAKSDSQENPGARGTRTKGRR